MSLPGGAASFDLPVGVLPSKFSAAVPSLKGIVNELPTVGRTYLLVAEPWDPHNYNLLLWTDDPTDDAWAKTDVSCATGIDDPNGGTDAWEVSADNVSNTDRIVQAIAGPDDRERSMRLWFKAGGAGSEDDKIDVLWRDTDGPGNFTATSYRRIRGPGQMVEQSSPRVYEVTGLSEDEWSEFEIVFPSGSPAYELTFYPGKRTKNDATVHVFRPQVQAGNESTDTRKTEDVTGPEGAPGQVVTVRLSNNGYATKPTDTPAHQHFPGGLSSPYNAAAQMFVAGSETASVPGFGDIEIINSIDGVRGALDWVTQLDWTNRSLKVYYGEFEDPFSNFTEIFRGTAEGLSWDSRTISIQLRTNEWRLQKQVQERLFGGFDDCLRFDGAVDAVDFDRHPACFIKGDLTVECRVRWFAKPSINATNTFAAFATSGEAEDGNISWMFRWNDSDQLSYLHEYDAGLNEEVLTPTGVTTDLYDGAWHHLAMTREVSTKTIRFYIGGELVHSEAYVDEPTGGETARLHIARHVASANEFEGDLDDVRVWDVVRTAEEIESARGRALVGNEDGLVAYYPFNEGANSDTYDEVTTIYRKQREVGLLFDGVDDDVVVTDHADFDPTVNGQITVEATIAAAIEDVGGANDNILRRDLTFHISQLDDRIRCAIYDGTTWRAESSNHVVTPGEIITVGLTWDDATETLSIYIGGELDIATQFSGSTINDGASDIDWGQGSARWAGWILEARYWNVTRTATEISENHDRQLVGSETGLKGYWKVNDNTGTTVTDSTSGGHDGTVDGANWVDTKGTLFDGASWVGSGEGTIHIAGKPWPVAYGECYHIPLVEVDPNNRVWAAAEGPIEEVVKVYEGGRALVGQGDRADVWAHDFTLTGNPTTSQGSGATVLIDTGATFVTDGIQVGALVRNDTDGGVGLVESVDSETQITHSALAGGTNDDWELTDDYEVISDFITDLARGYVRLNASPTLPLTATIKGDNTLVNGRNYVDNAAAIVRRLATKRSDFLDPSEVEVVDFQDVELEAPQKVGLYISPDESTTIVEGMSRVMASVTGVWRLTRDGKISVKVLKDPATLPSIITITDNDYHAGLLERLPTSPITWRQRVCYDRHWNGGFSREQLAGSLSEDLIDNYSQECRFAISENPTLKDTFLGAVEITLGDSTIVGESDAQAEAERRMALFGVERHLYRVPLLLGLFQYDLGDVVTLQAQRFNLSSGRFMMVVGWEEDVTSNDLNLILWG